MEARSQANQVANIGDSPDRKLSVSRIESYPLREPASGRRYCVIKVHTEDGSFGFGETGEVSAPDLAVGNQLVKGMQATAYEVLRRRLKALPNLQAAVNIALLDIVGKAAGVPVYQFLGGPTRFKARAMTALEGGSNDSLAASLNVVRKAGYRTFIVPPPPSSERNQGRAFVFAARKRFDRLREEAGEDVDFVLGGASRLSPSDAASLAREFESFHLLWFDEPCPVTNLATLRKIAKETVTPLGFGTSVHDGGVFQDLLREQLVDVLRPSLTQNGISQIRKMAALAETYYVSVAPFHNGGPIGTAAALHLAASLPNFFVQQIPRPAAETDQRMRAALAGSSVESVKDGYASLPTEPGLGISVNEEALEKYRNPGK